MKPNIRAILEDCIERGVEGGLRRARKQSEKPTDTHLSDSIVFDIWLNLDQYFLFEDEI